MNSIRKFLFKELDICGQHLSISRPWQQMIESRGYSKVVQQLFGELSALAIILANGMKHKGKITMQLQGGGAISLLLVEVSDDLKIRGMVKVSGVIDEHDNFGRILGKGKIVATLYNAQTKRNFQSLVSINSKGLIQTFEDYFSQSDQLASKIWILSNQDNLSAMLVQKMPDSKQNSQQDWDRILLLANTITHAELCELPAQSLLHKLFHEEVVTLFEKDTIEYECQQDREKFEKIIFNLGEKDARDLLKEHGEIAIHNEICNAHLFFDESDLDKIFSN
ncbi:molecular chaperone Hsp33 [Isorropodon fossajaponicum endosymbiont JTNG4]|uniref:Hsp33 family molecular chaperone HslO n=1 Tax=Isorropodon fossajaponicum symbiont TaxID=883811 RepID=UPI001915BD3E|nr:Hsp33 family molecular chaperone HslO [Isorropodon fossajaponicum symbiont]BBB24050.1 molecular chaperone Hsp33 [Isorropodon fossajaponicum endosymbiont JTNG4]